MEEQEKVIIMWALINIHREICKESGLYESKNSLLISHDLMALRGLESAEKHLCAKGKTPKKVEVSVGANTCNPYFVPSIKNVVDIKMVDYGCYHKDKSRVLFGIAIYLCDTYKDRGVNRFNISKDEQKGFNSFVFFDNIKVKGSTRKKALDMITLKTDAILQRNEIIISEVNLKIV